MAQAQKKAQEKRGRKSSERKILKNGLYEDQWARILADAKLEGSNEGVKVLRRIVDWYYTAKEQAQERLDGSLVHKESFEKLKKEKV